MEFTVCIIVNKWDPILLNCIRSYSEVTNEILLGCNNGFNTDSHPELNEFTNLIPVNLNWEGFGKTKNKLASLAKHDWILSVDADEVASPKLQMSLKAFNPKQEQQIYGFRVIYFIGEKALPHGPWGSKRHRYYRLYHRNYTSWNEKQVHEGIIFKQDTQKAQLAGELFHFTAKDFKELKIKHQGYAHLFAARLKMEGLKVSFIKPVMSSSFNFFRNYFLRLGFLDGLFGFKACRLMAAYTFWKYQLARSKSN